MNVHGGRVYRRLCVAGALLLFLLPLLPVAPAQAPSDPWWGPSDRTRPTEGFSVRIPVTVENTYDYFLFDPFVAVELDFAKLLIEAGWTNQTVGAELRLRGFTLDVDSLRVVPYNRGFVSGPINGQAQEPIPHVFYPALLEADKFREFDPARSPAGTVMFQIDTSASGGIPPQGKRDFYIYGKPVEYGRTEPFVPTDKTARGAIDAYLWGTTGTVTYGFNPNQVGQQHRIFIESVVAGPNKVTVSTLELGRYTPVAASTTFPNPFTLSGRGDAELFLVPAGKAYKIESERPVRVQSIGQNDQLQSSAREMRGYFPGWSGSFADDYFEVFVPREAASRYMVAKASPGSVTVTASHGGAGPITLTNADPVRQIGISPVAIYDTTNVPGLPDGVVSFSSPNGKFLVWSMTEQTPQNPAAYPLHQIPATTGGPSGTVFYEYLMNENGYVRICPETNASVYILNTVDEIALFPEGPIENTPPAAFTPSTFCEEIPVQRSANPRQLYEIYSTVPAGAPPGTKPAEFRVLLGAGERTTFSSDGRNYTRPPLGHFGGLGGVDYDLYGKVGIFGHYNGTRITIFEEKMRADGSTFTVNRTRGLQRDDFVALLPAADSTGRWHVVSNKPVSAASIEDARYFERDTSITPPEEIGRAISYNFHVPGRPAMPKATVGAADFRGPLIDLRSDAAPFLATGPGSPVTYRVDAINLGRWVNREDLTDTLTISCSTPVGWRVDGCSKEVTLGSRSSERLNIVITPSADDVNVTRSILVEARSKLGGVATYKISVHVEIRYGVGMWFDVEGGRKTIDPPIGLEPAGTHTYAVVIKNTGSTQDVFALSIDDPREGWTQDLLLDGEPVSDVRLDGGESVTLQFRVKAPNAETAPQNIVSIVAQSASSALAADIVNTATRIRPKVDLELTLEPQTRLAQPNETVLFNVTTRNKGNDVFTVLFEQDSILPEGWRAELSVPEITLNPNPANEPTLNYVLQLRVTPPEGARAGDLASVKLAAEIDTGGSRVPGDEISAVVVVRRVYNLTTPPIADAETLPGETLRFVLPIENRGNGQVSLELLPGAVEAALLQPGGDVQIVNDWGVSMDVAAVTLDLNQTADLPLTIEVPERTAPGLYNLSFTTRLSREAFQNLTIPVQVRELSRVEFEGASTVALVPGRPLVLGYVARNTGNVPGTFDLQASVPAGWQGNVSPTRAQLAPGDSVPVSLTLNATRDAANGDVVVRLESQAAPAPATPTDVRVRVARPQLFLSDVSATGDLRAGELVLVTANVGNTGTIDATNVSVALVVDEQVVDRVLLARVPVGSSSLATMSWVATQRGGDVRIVLDPEEEIALASRENTEAEVQFASNIPGPGLFALLVVLASLAGLRRGRRSARKERDEE